LMDLGDQYYHIPERAARKGFLQEHPELVAYFEMLRQKKDKYFLAAMANAFTDNPELWEMYLNKQLELTDALIAQMGKRTYVPTPKEEKRTGRRV